MSSLAKSVAPLPRETTGLGTEPERAPERSYRGMSPEERQRERRLRLLESALELFGTVGYAKTSISELCRHAGVTPRHFYAAFPTREALLRELIDEQIACTFAKVQQAVEAAPLELETCVRAGVGAFVRALVDDRRIARLLFVEAVGVSEDLERHRRSMLHSSANLTERVFTLCARTLEERPPKWRTAPGDGGYALVATALIGATRHLLMEWLEGQFEAPTDLVLESLVRLYMLVGLYW